MSVKSINFLCRFRSEKVDGAVLACWKDDLVHSEKEFTKNLKSEYNLSLVQTAKIKSEIKKLGNQ